MAGSDANVVLMRVSDRSEKPSVGVQTIASHDLDLLGLVDRFEVTPRGFDGVVHRAALSQEGLERRLSQGPI